MNYYIQGNKEKAEEIKAAFEAKGFIPRMAPMYYGSESVLFFTGTDNYIYETPSPWVMDIIKTHPDYKELPVEPKFKVGDWVVTDYGKVSQVVSVDNAGDGYTLDDGVYFSGSWCDMYHLWSIADAKDGDVLVTTKIRNCPFIYRKTDRKNNLAYYYAGIDGDGDFSEGCLKRTLCHFGLVSDVIPATKEQRDLLFQKMKEAGYEWDEKKKELRKIKPHYDIANFKPFDKVLERNYDTDSWTADLFSHYVDDEDGKAFVTICSYRNQCIPYEGNEHLLGTTDMCDEMYINW